MADAGGGVMDEFWIIVDAWSAQNPVALGVLFGGAAVFAGIFLREKYGDKKTPKTEKPPVDIAAIVGEAVASAMVDIKKEIAAVESRVMCALKKHDDKNNKDFSRGEKRMETIEAQLSKISETASRIAGFLEGKYGGKK